MKIVVQKREGMRFEAQIRNHVVPFDTRSRTGGANTAANPLDTMVASLGACVGMYAAIACKELGLSAEGMKVRVDFVMAPDPMRVSRMNIAIELTQPLTNAQQVKILEYANACTIENTLLNPPEITVVMGS